jgi:hypothetical protein
MRDSNKLWQPKHVPRVIERLLFVINKARPGVPRGSLFAFAIFKRALVLFKLNLKALFGGLSTRVSSVENLSAPEANASSRHPSHPFTLEGRGP